MRKINKNLIDGFKREVLCAESGIGYYTLGRIIKGQREATKTEQIALCQVTGLDAEDLFPIDQDEEQAS